MKKQLSFSQGIDPSVSTGTKKIRTLPISDITISEDFSSIFEINSSLVQSIADSMSMEGFKPQFPLHVWKTTDDEGNEENILIGGHTRFAAAKQANLLEVYVQFLDLPDLQSAKLAAYEDQIYRRNLSSKDLLTAIDKYMDLGGDCSIKSLRTYLQDITGLSPATCNRAIAISRDATAKQAVEKGASIGGAYAELMRTKYHREEDEEECEQDNTDPAPMPSFDHGGHREDYTESREDTPEEKKRLEDLKNRESTASVMGKEDGFILGFKAGFIHALYSVHCGQSVKEVFNSIPDLSSRQLINYMTDGDTTEQEKCQLLDI